MAPKPSRKRTGTMVSLSKQMETTARKRVTASEGPPSESIDSVDSTDHTDINAESTTDPNASTDQRTRHIAKKKLNAMAFDAKYGTRDFTKEEFFLKQANSWDRTSDGNVYEGYEWPPRVFTDSDDCVAYEFRCKICLNVLTRTRHNTSSGNLRTHQEKCRQRQRLEAQAASIEAAAAMETLAALNAPRPYDKARFRFLCDLWIIKHHRPFNILKDEELRMILHMLNPSVRVHSPSTVSRDVREIFGITKVSVIALLKSYPGMFHLGVDGWTSPNVFSFLGVTVHFIRDGAPFSLVLDFVKMSSTHTGFNLASKLAACVQEYGIERKILGVVSDNASNNSTLVTELGFRLPQSPIGTQSRVNCFAHTMNLVSKAVIQPLFTKFNEALNSPITAFMEDAEGDVDEEEVEAEREAADAVDIGEAVEQVRRSLPVAVKEKEHEDGRNAMVKVHGAGKRVFYSSILRTDLEAICKRMDVPFKTLPRPCKTRWNTTAELLDAATKLDAPMDALTLMESHNTGGNKLSQYRLVGDEKLIIKQLNDLLHPFLLGTTRIEQAGVALLHTIIPMMDRLTSHVEDFAQNPALHPVVRLAALRGRAILNKYYALTDDSLMYRLAIIFNPRYKLDYFKKAKWPTEWSETARQLAAAEWRDRYKPTPATPSAEPTTPAVDFFDDFMDVEDISTQDALDVYLSQPVVPSCTNPIAYWLDRGGFEDPLSRMALDFLCMPATSVDVERAFSRGSLTVSRLRHRLSDESTRTSTVLSTWAKVPGLIPEVLVCDRFRERHRTKTKGKGKAKEIVSEPPRQFLTATESSSSVQG